MHEEIHLSMSTVDVLALKDTVVKPALTRLPLQETSLDIWDKKYRLKTKDGQNVDNTIADTFIRVARALADVEKTEADRQKWYKEFLWALEQGAIPAGRITSNAGALEHKPATSTINCTVSGTITDSMDDILGKVHEAGLTLKAGCGIGYDFSTLRPRGAYVSPTYWNSSRRSAKTDDSDSSICLCSSQKISFKP